MLRFVVKLVNDRKVICREGFMYIAFAEVPAKLNTCSMTADTLQYSRNRFRSMPMGIIKNHSIVSTLCTVKYNVKSTQSLQEPLRNQSLHISLSHIQLTIFGQIDHPVSSVRPI